MTGPREQVRVLNIAGRGMGRTAARVKYFLYSRGVWRRLEKLMVRGLSFRIVSCHETTHAAKAWNVMEPSQVTMQKPARLHPSPGGQCERVPPLPKIA